MKRYYLITSIFIISHLFCSAQVYEATIGGDGFDVLNAVKGRVSGGMLAAGNGTYDGNSQLLFLTTNGIGQIVTAKTIGDDGAEFGQDIVRTIDNGFAICGWTTQNGSDDILVVKLFDTGDVQWVKVFEDSGIDRARALMESGDGSLIVVGHSNSGGLGVNDVVVIKIDTNGEAEWKYKYGGPNNDNAWGVAQSVNGNYIVAGNSASFHPDNFTSAFLMEIDQDGELIWSKTIAVPEGQMAATDCEISTSEDIVIGGWAQAVGSSDRQGMIARFAFDGTFESAEVFGGMGFESVNDIAMEGQEILAAGVTSSYFLNTPDTDNGFVTRFNEENEIVMFQGFESGEGGDDDELFGVDINILSDDGFYACGVYDADEIRQGHIIQSFDFWDDCPTLFTEINQFNVELMEYEGGSRTDDESTLSEPTWTATDLVDEAEIICSTGLNTLEEEAETWNLFPNPAQDYFELENVKKGTSILLKDITGRTVLETKYSDQRIEVSSWKRGIYILTIGKVKSMKLIVK